jgi:uncharacterized membrane protein YedE/YeeE
VSRVFIAGAAGLLFGLGLIVSGMADPGKVIGFLDLAGRWDPSLACVMAGAVAVAAGGFALGRRCRASLTGEPLAPPASGRIDAPLLAGAALFGLGWGLAGICPGPALVLTGAANTKAGAFVVAMLAGMLLMALPFRGAGRRAR